MPAEVRDEAPRVDPPRGVRPGRAFAVRVSAGQSVAGRLRFRRSERFWCLRRTTAPPLGVVCVSAGQAHQHRLVTKVTPGANQTSLSDLPRLHMR